MKAQLGANTDVSTIGKLECNPEGNYAWLEEVTPLPITAAIAGVLADPVTCATAGDREGAAPDVAVNREMMVS